MVRSALRKIISANVFATPRLNHNPKHRAKLKRAKKKKRQLDTHGSSSHLSRHHSHWSHHTASGWGHRGGCHIGNLQEDHRSPPLLEDKDRNGLKR